MLLITSDRTPSADPFGLVPHWWEKNSAKWTLRNKTTRHSLEFSANVYCTRSIDPNKHSRTMRGNVRFRCSVHLIILLFVSMSGIVFGNKNTICLCLNRTFEYSVSSVPPFVLYINQARWVQNSVWVQSSWMECVMPWLCSIHKA